MNDVCSIELLRNAVARGLSAEEEAALHAHLEHCEACCAQMEQLAGGEAWQQEAAALLSADELDAAVPEPANWSEVDFSVEHLDPSDDANVLGQLGGYDVLAIVGRGGMGVVLKAFDRELKRLVAIKALAPHLAHSSVARKRFAREAQAAAAVVNPHVIAIHHVQPTGRLPFLIMPLLTGESLAQRLKARGPLELTEVLRIGMQAATGLAAAHDQGLVHRDVKPANIFVEKGVERVVITDFGLARAADDVSMTRQGVVAGTPEYMSPEQARGEALDGRSDLFSLGCVLYEMATGVSPFRTDSTMATLRRIVDEQPAAMASLVPELPPWFSHIVERLLSKDPAQRFASASEVSQLLEQCLSHLQQPSSVSLPASLVPHAAGRRSIFNVTRKGVIAMLGTIGVTLLGMVLWQATEAPDISGQWTSEEWGTVVLEAKQPGQYEGTFTGSDKDKPAYDITDIPVVTEGGFGTAPVLTESKTGTIQLKWSRVERRFNGTWRKGVNRSGKMSLRLVDNEIRGAWTTSKDAQKESDSPRLADLLWKRSMVTVPDGGTVLLGGPKSTSEAAKTPTELKVPGLEKPLELQNARSVVEAYVAAALAGRVEQAASLAKGTPAVRNQIESIPRQLNVQRLAIQSVYVNDPTKPVTALATSEAVKLSKPNPDGQRDGFLLLTLTMREGGWFVTDIDFESEECADRELKKFLEANPKSIGSPPLTDNGSSGSGIDWSGYARGPHALRIIERLKPAWSDTKFGIAFGVSHTTDQHKFNPGERVPLAMFVRNTGDATLKVSLTDDFYWNVVELQDARGVSIPVERVELQELNRVYSETLKPGEAFGFLHQGLGLHDGKPRPVPFSQRGHRLEETPPYWKVPVAGTYTLRQTKEITIEGLKDTATFRGPLTSGTVAFEVIEPPPATEKGSGHEKPLDRQNARAVGEALVAAGLSGRFHQAVSLGDQSKLLAEDWLEFRYELEGFFSQFNVQRLAIKSVYVNDPAKPTTALAISEEVKLFEKQPNGQRYGCLVLKLTMSKEGWSFTSVSLDSDQSADRELKKFLEANPKSISVPPQAASEAAKSATGLAETKSVDTQPDEKPVAKPDWVVAGKPAAKPPGANIVKVPDDQYVKSGFPVDELAGEGVKWNEVQNGLSLGFRITGDEWRILGKDVKVELWVRNPGDKDVRFQLNMRPDIGLRMKMKDANGKERESSIMPTDVPPFGEHRLLPPGQAFKVKELTISLLWPENDGSGIEGHYFLIDPGAYKFHCELELPGISATGEGGKQLTPAAGEWTGKLTTGKMNVMVVAPDAPAPTRRN